MSEPKVTRRDMPDIEFVVIATAHDYHVEYAIYNSGATDKSGLMLLQRRGAFSFDPVETIEEAEVYLHGDVKWDGCSNWHFDEQDRVMLHGCSRECLTRLGEVMARCWDWTAELCPHWNAEVTGHPRKAPPHAA